VTKIVYKSTQCPAVRKVKVPSGNVYWNCQKRVGHKGDHRDGFGREWWDEKCR